MPEALERGIIDAYSAWAHYPMLGVSRYNNQKVIHRNLSSGFLYFSPSLTMLHSEAAHRIAASGVRAINWLKERDNNLSILAGGR